MDFVFAYLAGVLTLINPCVIPVLPIVIAGALANNKFGPLALVAGLCLSFTIAGITIAAFGPALGIDEDIISRTAAVFMIVLGVIVRKECVEFVEERAFTFFPFLPFNLCL